MSAPIIWIGIPFLTAVILLGVTRPSRLTSGIAAALCMVLALLAWQLPIGSTAHLGPLNFELTPALVLLGRRIVLANDDRAFLTFIYSFGFAWFVGYGGLALRRHFVSIGLGIITLLVAAQAVDPFLYAALLIEMAVLLSIPLLISGPQQAGSGVLRYLVFQTMALPFILLAGWAAASIEANPAETRLLVQAIALLGFGFTCWLATFPFYTWVPLLTSQVHPYVSGFILTFLPGVVLFLALGFLDSYSWLRTNQELGQALRLIGTLMVVTAGIWAIFQQDARRIFGYAIIMENGFALLALSLRDTTGLQIFVTAFLPRFFGILLYAMALSVLEKYASSTSIQNLRGWMKNAPFAAVGLVAAHFSLGGLPLLSGFPVRLALIESVTRQSLPIALWILIGSAGFWLAGLRMLAALVSSAGSGWKLSEKWSEVILLGVGILFVFVTGIFPGTVLPGMLDLLQPYTHLR